MYTVPEASASSIPAMCQELEGWYRFLIISLPGLNSAVYNVAVVLADVDISRCGRGESQAVQLRGYYAEFHGIYFDIFAINSGSNLTFFYALRAY